jgi:hypothetical protein
LTSASATWRIGRSVFGEPARRFGFRDNCEDLDGFGRDVIENSYLPDPESILWLPQARRLHDFYHGRAALSACSDITGTASKVVGAHPKAASPPMNNITAHICHGNA